MLLSLTNLVSPPDSPEFQLCLRGNCLFADVQSSALCLEVFVLQVENAKGLFQENASCGFTPTRNSKETRMVRFGTVLCVFGERDAITLVSVRFESAYTVSSCQQTFCFSVPHNPKPL